MSVDLSIAIEHLGVLVDGSPALARRALAELRGSLERVERNLRRDDRTAGQLLRQSRIDELRILALEYEMARAGERVQVARLIHGRLVELGRDATEPGASIHESTAPGA